MYIATTTYRRLYGPQLHRFVQKPKRCDGDHIRRVPYAANNVVCPHCNDASNSWPDEDTTPHYRNLWHCLACGKSFTCRMPHGFFPVE